MRKQINVLVKPHRFTQRASITNTERETSNTWETERGRLTGDWRTADTWRLLLDDYRAEFSPSVMMKMMKMMMQKQPESRSNDLKLEKWSICFYVHIKFVWCYSDLFFTSGAFFGNYEDFLDFCFRSSGLIEILFHCLNYSNCIIIHFMDVDGSKCVYNAAHINQSPSETSSEGADGFRN